MKLSKILDNVVGPGCAPDCHCFYCQAMRSGPGPITPSGSYEAARNIYAEPVRETDPNTGGQKESKLEAYQFIPVEPLAEVARVYGFGAKKYADRNWERGYKWGLSYAALQRHINAFWARQDIDPESGQHHLAHAVFHCLALMEWGKTHPELDDRSK